jgi:fatty-acyl-CoA synthase
MTLASALGASAAGAPRQPALVAGPRRLTYGELDDEVTRLARVLVRNGLGVGRAVALLLPSGREAVCSFFAVARAGAVAVPLATGLRAHELDAVFRDIRPAAVLAARRVAGNDIEAVLGSTAACPPVVLFSDELEREHPSSEERLPEVDPSAVAAVFYTTGTTGTPKGVVHSHAALLESFLALEELHRRFFSGPPRQAVARASSLVRRYGARLRHGIGRQTWFTPLPVHSIAGFRFALHALLAGHRLVLMEPFRPREALDLVERERAAIVAVAPSMLEAMLSTSDLDRRDLSSLLVIGLGSAPTPPALVRRARSVLGCAVVVGYGATETGGGVLVTRLDDDDEQLAETVGRPFPGSEVRIVDPDRREVPAGTVGELACRLPGLMKGYHGHPDATAEVVDAEGWYYTGDLATADREGYVRIVGRVRDLIIRGGQNVVPLEVERVLLEHPAVAQAAVVGVPDRMAGEAIWAFLVPAAEDGLDVAALRSFCAARLSVGKLPDHFRLRDELPVAESGEIKKTDLREAAVAELAPSDLVPADREETRPCPTTP